MGSFKFKPDSVLEFHCPGIGTSTTQAEAVKYFNQYLTSIGKSVDSNGYLDTDTFMVRNATTSSYQTNTLDKQYSSYYMNGSTVLYKGCLYTNFSAGASFIGYVTLPFKVNGSNVRLVLPGTLITSYNNLGLINSGTGTIQRTSSGITVGSQTTQSTKFENQIVPLFCIVLAIGGGGGGSSSEALVAGRGGGGGAAAFGVINLLSNSALYNYSVGSGGTGGSHQSGDSATASRHDGSAGGSTILTANGGAITLISAGGGRGGVAQSTSCANGGSVSTNNCPYYLYTSSTQTTNKGGGKGSVDTATTGTTVTSVALSPYSSSTVRDYLSNPTILSAKTYNPGASRNPGGAGGGATIVLNGSDGGSLSGSGVAGSNGYGTGGGGGGYLVGSYISGGKGGNGRIQFYC